MLRALQTTFAPRLATVAEFIILFSLAITPSFAQTFTSLISFRGTNGEMPYGSLVQGRDGNLYGTTFKGGTNKFGTVFKITPTGVLTTLHAFDGDLEGGFPAAGLLLGTDGNFYGTTILGGSQTGGTVFKITSLGAFSVLANFPATGAQFNVSALILGLDGNFYGTRSHGGTGCGTVFKVTPSGTLTDIHTFSDGGPNGCSPIGSLALGLDGNFYGTTSLGGADDFGMVFKITPSGGFTVLCSFPAGSPSGGVTLASDGNFYGTTQGSLSTVFKITPSGMFTTLYTFSGADGEQPNAVIEGTDGNFYGTTTNGGANSYGTVFTITPAGVLTTLHNFDGTDGKNALGAVLQSTNGTFYGTTYAGGILNGQNGGDGTVFSESTGLGPFVAFVEPWGIVGRTIEILGQGLTGTTGVSFNGIAATSFSVVTDTFMTAVVPTGATTGPVAVTTPSGTLTSNVNFFVR